MKKNSFKTAVLMTIMALPLAMYIIGVRPLVASEGDGEIQFVERREDASENNDAADETIVIDAQPEDVNIDVGYADKLGAVSTTDDYINNESIIIIDIAGEIVTPGVYVLKEGSRLIDAIEMAGGLTEKADVRFINRAEIIFDGSKIYIPAKEEATETSSGTTYASSGGATYATAGRTTVTGGANQLININTASSEELQKIPGVGPSTAEKIIAYRTTYGKFKTIEDLINISGIGNKTLEKMKGYITVR